MKARIGAAVILAGGLALVAGACKSTASAPKCLDPAGCNTTSDGSGGSGAGGEGGTSASGNGAMKWAEAVGDASEQHPSRITVDAKGNVVLTGFFEGTLAFKNAMLKATQYADIYVAKLEPDMRTAVWAFSIGDSNDKWGDHLIVPVKLDASGNVYVAGVVTTKIQLPGGTPVANDASARPDPFVAKLDGTTGKQIWLKTFDTKGKFATVSDLAVDAKGDVAITGRFFTGVTFDPKDSTKNIAAADMGIYVAKLSGMDGSPAWAMSMTHTGMSAEGDMGRGIAFAPNGEITMTGEFVEKLDIPGQTSLASVGQTDALIARLDGGSGKVKWTKQIGASNYDRGTALCDSGDMSGGFIVAGTFVGQSIDLGTGAFKGMDGMAEDMFVASYDAAGKPLWAQFDGNNGQQQPSGVAIDGDGNVVVVGSFSTKLTLGSSLTYPNTAAFVLKLDGPMKGAPLWAVQLGQSDFAVGRGIAADGSGDSFVTVEMRGKIAAGSKILETNGKGDLFFAESGRSDKVGDPRARGRGRLVRSCR